MKKFVTKIDVMYLVLLVVATLFMVSLLKFMDRPEVQFSNATGKPILIISPSGIESVKPGDSLPSWYKRVNVNP